MTPRHTHRPAIGLSAWIAVVALALALGGSRSSSSVARAHGVLPLELARQFPELQIRLSDAPVPVELAPSAPERDPAVEAGRYLRRLPFGREIDRAAREQRLDALLVASIVEAESSFRPDAVSEKGALGLMQLMPLHLEGVAEPLDPAVNLRVGTRYLAGLERRFDGDLELALAAYHAGPGAVERWGGMPPYRSTRDYVGRVLALYREHRTSLEQAGAG